MWRRATRRWRSGRRSLKRLIQTETLPMAWEAGRIGIDTRQTETWKMRTSPLWTPPETRRQDSNLITFAAELEERTGRTFPSYRDLHAFSVADPESFWLAVWDFCRIKAAERGDCVFAPGRAMREA